MKKKNKSLILSYLLGKLLSWPQLSKFIHFLPKRLWIGAHATNGGRFRNRKSWTSDLPHRSRPPANCFFFSYTCFVVYVMFSWLLASRSLPRRSDTYKMRSRESVPWEMLPPVICGGAAAEKSDNWIWEA